MDNGDIYHHLPPQPEDHIINIENEKLEIKRTNKDSKIK